MITNKKRRLSVLFYRKTGKASYLVSFPWAEDRWEITPTRSGLVSPDLTLATATTQKYQNVLLESNHFTFHYLYLYWLNIHYYIFWIYQVLNRYLFRSQIIIASVALAIRIISSKLIIDDEPSVKVIKQSSYSSVGL